MLYSDIVPLIYVNEIICMVIYFMAQDEPFGAKIIPKCILQVRGLGAILNFKTFLSFINRLLVTIQHPAED